MTKGIPALSVCNAGIALPFLPTFNRHQDPVLLALAK
jgi:hypothetical protein